MVYHNLKTICAVSPHGLTVIKLQYDPMKTVGRINRKQGNKVESENFKKCNNTYQNLVYRVLRKAKAQVRYACATRTFAFHMQIWTLLQLGWWGFQAHVLYLPYLLYVFGYLNSLPHLLKTLNKYNLLADVLSKHCWMSGKQWRPCWDTTFWGISTGSTLSAQACLAKYIW